MVQLDPEDLQDSLREPAPRDLLVPEEMQDPRESLEYLQTPGAQVQQVLREMQDPRESLEQLDSRGSWEFKDLLVHRV